IITINGSSTITHEAGTPYTDAGATATDNVDDDTAITNAIVATSTVNTSVVGDYTVTYGVSDSSGNPAVEITRIVQVRDTIAPVITLVGNSSVTAERGSLYVDAGATAEDNFEGSLVPAVTGTVDTDTPGTYTIRYNVSDSSGNAASEVTREIIVADTIIPTIVLEGVSPQIIEFGDGYIELGATANDTYDGDITANIVIDASAVNTNALGSYTVRYNVTDSSNNTANEVTRAVEVRDTTAPAGLSIDPVATPTNITPQTIAGTKEANSSVLLGGVEIVPADGLATWNYNLNLTEGTNGISLTLKDASGNESGVVLSSITLDTELPTITGVITNTSYSGSITPTFSDNLAIASATLNGLPFPSGTEVPDEGVYELIVTDTAGNTRTVTFTVDFTTPATPVVNPVTTPTNIVSQIIVGTKDADTSIWIDGAQVVALDPATAWSINVALLEGDNTFSIMAKDAAGNVSSSSVIVIVRDTTGPAAPQANVPEGNYNDKIFVTLTLAPDAEETFFTVNGGEPTVTSTEYVGGTIGINGTNGETKTLKAVSFDALGNRGSTMSINYTFDTEGPAITLNGSSTVSIEQGRTYVDEGAIATDAADGNLTANITTSTTLNNLVIGTYTLTYSVTDSAGNTGSTIQTIEVTGDVTAPELTMLGDNPFTLEQGVTYTDAGALATDLVDGNINDSIIITNPVNIDIPATYTITYAIEDTAGNSTSTTRTVIVNPDATPPVIALTGSASVEAAGGNAYNDAGATANDNIDGIITGNIITTNPVNTDAGGTYIVRYNVADTRGNAAGEVTREVNVANDITAPVITINGENPTNIELKRVYFDAGASASDAVNGVVAVTAVSTVNTEIMNSYTVTYTARDASGNVATAIRTVNVTADVTPPVITIIGGKTINIIASSTYADAGATALDNVQGNVTTGIVSLNTVNAAVVGTYTISYNITDSAGNKAVEVIRTVHVVAEGGDATLPVITLIGSSTVEVAQGTAYTELGATASDNVDGDITANIITSSTVDTNVLGEYAVTYNVADTAGNAAEEVIRTVRVADITAPVIALIGNSSVNIKKLSTYTDVGATASDDTDGDVSARVTSTSTVDTATAGAYAVTYNVSDAAGNEATPAVRTVNVNELSTPVLANLTPTNTPLFILASSTVQMTVDLSDADDERISYNAEITSTDPDTSHWPALTKFTPFEPTVGLNNFNAIGAVKFTIQTKEFWNNATLTITARDRDGNEAAITRSVRTRP
ncbi:MAG: DUF5011 domain-containing protein, partial [Candidatus Wolfebacteria bacterium]|nr:DUF5011 domain-containing protein [Candidatus Wolfebacteria bacterium]